MHDLRPTFAAILFDAGASAPDVQATLGHSRLQVTERHSRAREGVALRAGAALDQALADMTDKPAGTRRRGSPGRSNGPTVARTRRGGGRSRPVRRKNPLVTRGFLSIDL